MRRLLVCFLVVVFSSCFEKNSSSTNEVDDLTVQANIKEGDFAEVYLTKAIPFSGVIDSITVIRAIESKAKVVVADSFGRSEILTLKKDETRYPFFFYRGNSIKGEVGEEYSVSIQLEGKIFNSVTTIPLKPIVDSFSFIDSYQEGLLEEGVKDMQLILRNNTEGLQYYKFWVEDGLEEKFFRAKPFIINTQNIGIGAFPLVIEFEKLNLETDEIDNKFIEGGEFVLDIIAITKEEYEFLKAIGGDETTLLEGFSFSEQIPSNITGNAFGYWSGENTLKIPFVVK